MRGGCVIVFLILLSSLLYGPASSGLAQSELAQSGPAWAGIIDPGRADDWSKDVGIPGGIPNWTTVCMTVPPSGDTTGAKDTLNIDNAILACAGKSEAVQLTKGMYYSTGIRFGCTEVNNLKPATTVNNVVLRGAGPNQTIIKFISHTGCAWQGEIVIPGQVNVGNQRFIGDDTWTGGYAHGSASLTVGNIANYQVGQMITLDQIDDDTAIDSITETGSTATVTTGLPHGFKVGDCIALSGTGATNAQGINQPTGYNGWWSVRSVLSPTSFTYSVRCNANSPVVNNGPLAAGLAPSGVVGYVTKDTGGVLVSINPNPAIIGEQGTRERFCPDTVDRAATFCSPGEVSVRTQTEIKRVTAIIPPNMIQVWPPVSGTNWRAGQKPGIYWFGNPAMYDGVEDMTVDYNAVPTSSQLPGITFFETEYGWVKNVRSLDGNRDHVMNVDTLGNQFEDNYFFGTHSGGTKSYGIETFTNTSADLMQNNICQHVVTCMMTGNPSHSVFAYNYSEDEGTQGGKAPVLMCTLAIMHDNAAMDLFEGNVVTCAGADDIHGTEAMGQTLFRNRLRGQDTPPRDNLRDVAMDMAWNRGMNFIGNVMGTVGVQKQYQSLKRFTDGYIWDLQDASNNYQQPADPLVIPTLLRWGNWDVVTGAARFNPGEIPTTAHTYIPANAVPSMKILPPSFYLTARPSWFNTKFGAVPIPAIGPDVTGGNSVVGVAGHADSIPAELCYRNTPVDPAYAGQTPQPLLFDANRCYS